MGITLTVLDRSDVNFNLSSTTCKDRIGTVNDLGSHRNDKTSFLPDNSIDVVAESNFVAIMKKEYPDVNFRKFMYLRALLELHMIHKYFHSRFEESFKDFCCLFDIPTGNAPGLIGALQKTPEEFTKWFVKEAEMHGIKEAIFCEVYSIFQGCSKQAFSEIVDVSNSKKAETVKGYENLVELRSKAEAGSPEAISLDRKIQAVEGYLDWDKANDIWTFKVPDTKDGPYNTRYMWWWPQANAVE
jgi:hypothetical protein